MTPSAGHSTGVSGGGGFDVDTDVLARIAHRFTVATDLIQGAENTRGMGLGLFGAPEATPGVARPVPGWLPDYDRGWQALRDEVLNGHDVAVRELRRTAVAYLDGDDQLAAGIEVIGRRHPAYTVAGAGELSDAAFPATGSRATSRPAESPVGRADARHSEHSGDLDTAIALWRRRRDHTAEAVAVLHTALTDPHWHGPAAEAFTAWAHTHLQRATTLADHAAHVHAILTDTTAPRAATPPDPLPALPAPAAFPALPAPPSVQDAGLGTGPVPTSTTPGPPAPVAAAGGSPPAPFPPAAGPVSVDLPGMGEPHNPTPATSPASPARARLLDDDDLNDLNDLTDRADAQGRVGDARADLAPNDTDTVLGRPAEPDSTPPQPAPNPAQGTGSGSGQPPPSPERHESAQQHPLGGDGTAGADAAAREEALPETEPVALPVVAIASAALFARTDRGHHVIGDIPLPPTPPGPSAGSGPVGAARRSHPTTAAAGQPPDGPGPGSGQREPALDGGSTPLGHPLPADHAPAAVWLNLAAPDDPPAWIDLAATGGLGLDGRGAANVARTVWRRLRAHDPRTLLVIPAALARQLLGHPMPGHIADDPAALLVDNPGDGLTAAQEQAQRRRRAGRHTAPVVLFAPAPVTVSAQTALSSALRPVPPPVLGAVLLGHWDSGTTLIVTEDHHVSHTHRTPARQPPLTGARLEPTTPDQLDHADTPDLRPTLQATAPAFPHPHHEDSPNTATTPDGKDRKDREDGETGEPGAAGGTGPPRTLLALSVLGPVQLRYRRPATTPPTHHARRSAAAAEGEEVVAVSGISKPGRELLAYLAAHPGGATRDAIVEALWPDSTADRPDTAFHTTLSRLRKRLRDTTGSHDTAEIITAADGRYHLHRAHVTVDYWTFLETHPRNPDPTLRRHDHYHAIALYQGPFAADITGEWAHTIREATRRRYLEAIHDLATTEITNNPDLALDLLHRARNLEPLNEAIYRTIMRIHINAGRYDDAHGTYQLLRTHLATIEATPDAATEKLAATLRNSTSAARTV